MQKWIVILLSIAFPLIVVGVYYFYNETNSTWSMQCTFYQATGCNVPDAVGNEHYITCCMGNLPVP